MSRRERHAEGMSKLSDAQLHIGRKPESDALSTWRGIFEPSAKVCRGG